jgi:hypothetical protein
MGGWLELVGMILQEGSDLIQDGVLFLQGLAIRIKVRLI